MELRMKLSLFVTDVAYSDISLPPETPTAAALLISESSFRAGIMLDVHQVP